MVSSFAPANETPTELWNEQMILYGIFLGAIAYGIHVALAFMAFHLLWARRKATSDYVFLAYVAIVFVLGSIGNATYLKFGEMSFISNRDYPGGPGAYFMEQSTIPVSALCNSVYVVNGWFQDGLLLYRFWLIWGRNYYITVLPCITFTASIGLSCAFIYNLSQPDLTAWSGNNIDIALAYWSMTVATNVILTLAIAGRLLHMQWQLRRAMNGSGDVETPYMSVTAMLVESAFIYSASGLVLLGSIAANSPVENLAFPILGQTQSIAPLLIIVRVAQGRAWRNESSAATIANERIRFHTRSSVGKSTDIPLSPRRNNRKSFPALGDDESLAGDCASTSVPDLHLRPGTAAKRDSLTA
ncbi:hypothetical protein PLICRDRAFT_142209 [Plicaturopsis crispa FD-325 SS-3]|nr:hypothetical protein PLICRDRAFT_142209 [Plicaturopsis crispa FD-325 SS-3]